MRKLVKKNLCWKFRLKLNLIIVEKTTDSTIKHTRVLLQQCSIEIHQVEIMEIVSLKGERVKRDCLACGFSGHFAK